MAGKRIPPPPVVRDRLVVERVVESVDSSATTRTKRMRAASDVDVSDVLFLGVGGETESKLRRRLIEAAVAFERERFADAYTLLKSIDRLAPGVPEVLELLGLSLYRQGKWQQAIKQLEAFEQVTGTVEQHPVLADCYRARRDWSKVDQLWKELGEHSPSAELIEEGRIVLAGARADQGRIKDAIRVLEEAPRAPKKPKPHHLRRWYALADLYERAGDTKRARRLFQELEHLEPGLGDVALRIKQLH